MTPAVVDRLSIDSTRLHDAAREQSCIHALATWMALRDLAGSHSCFTSSAGAGLDAARIEEK
jgi:hypothetical protein